MRNCRDHHVDVSLVQRWHDEMHEIVTAIGKRLDDIKYGAVASASVGEIENGECVQDCDALGITCPQKTSGTGNSVQDVGSNAPASRRSEAPKEAGTDPRPSEAPREARPAIEGDDLHTRACLEYAAKTRRSYCIVTCADARAARRSNEAERTTMNTKERG